MEAEVWRPVEGAEHIEVSNLGRVRRWKNNRKQRNRWDAPQVAKLTGNTRRRYLHTNVAGRSTSIHTLVAAAFIGPRPPGMQVDHINGVRTDNRAVNLRYVTPAENSANTVRLGRQARPKGETNGHAKLTAIDVRTIRRLHMQGQHEAELGRLFGVSRRTIYDIIHHKTWAHIA